MSHFSMTIAGGLWLPAVVFWALVPRPLPAQQTEQRSPVIRTDVNTVLVDAVFRDKRGRALRDLKQDEVKISENGVAQQILSFRQVRSAGVARADLEPTVQGSQAGSIQVSRQIRLVTLVFERLGNQQRTLAGRRRWISC